MQIRCPHCHVPFDSVEQASWADMLCPACGSSFSLSGADATYSYRPGVQVLGHFELLQQVGAGRFGSVWKARDTQLQRTVAIKIPRQRDLDPKETEVFLRDARAAAQLNHPRIAGVHEVGRESDTVYIVTDYIDGANLSEWLTGQKLTSREAAELVVKISEALHHAHEAGVVHRDLKPSNIMLDQDGEPHVIDFGLARRETGEIAMTVEGQILGTPAYMSPEQARGEGHTADRRSDVYALGVILFELLTGELPFRGDARMLIVQILNEEPPSPRKLKGSVSRDLETITHKCLQKDPVKRYQTAQDLADDLKRYLAKEPIQARPIGRAARAWRWCRRNPMVASLATAVFAILTIGIVTSSYFAASASREAAAAKSSLEQAELQQKRAEGALEKAELQQKRAEGVNAFLTDEVFGLADPNRGGRTGLGLVEALDLAAGKIDQRFPDDPELRAMIRDRFGELYSGTDKPQLAVEQSEQAVALRTKLAGGKDAATLKSRSDLGHALYLAGRYKESREVLQAALADQTEIVGAAHPEAVHTAVQLSVAYMEEADPENLETARQIAENAFQQSLAARGSNDYSTLDAQCTLSWILRWQGKSAKALEPAKAAAIGLRELKGSDNVPAMFAAHNYALCLQLTGQFDKSVEELEPLVQARYRILGRAHVDSLYSALNLVISLRSAEKPAKALAVLEDLHAHLDEIRGVNNLRRANPLSGIGREFMRLQRNDRAADIFAVIYEMYMKAQGEDARGTVFASWLDGLAVRLAGPQLGELRNPERAVELATKACEATDYKDATAIKWLAIVYLDTGNNDATVKWFDKACESQPDNVELHYHRALALLHLDDLARYHEACAAMSKQFASSPNDEARYFLAWSCGLGPEAVDDLNVPIKIAQDLVSKKSDQLQYLVTLGALQYRAGNYEEAAKRLTETGAAAERKGSEDIMAVNSQVFLAMTKWKLGDKEEAKRLLAKAQAAMDTEMKTIPAWNRRATLEIFRREAEALISETNAGSSATAQ